MQRVSNLMLDQVAHDGCVVGGRAATGIGGRLGHHHRPTVECKRRRDRLGDPQEFRHGLAAHRDQLLTERARERIGLRLVILGNHQHAAAEFRNVGIREAVRDRDRQYAFFSFEGLDTVDESPHQRQCSRVARNLAAVVERHYRPDLAAQGAQDEIKHVLGAFDHVGVGKFLNRR